MRFLHKNCLFGPYYTTYQSLTGMLPHSCTASSQALSVNAFPWRIQLPETYRQPRSQVLSLASRKNLIAAGHVAPKIWEPK